MGWPGFLAVDHTSTLQTRLENTLEYGGPNTEEQAHIQLHIHLNYEDD
jgi:hypothetical protein